MIEATSENIWYKKKKHRFKFKRFFSLLLVGLIFIAIFFYYREAICRQIINICSDYSYAFSADAVNKAVLNSLADSVKYDDLVSVEKNTQGEIVMISTNSTKVNRINREVADNTKQILQEKMNAGVPVPLLAFTGFSLLAGYGGIVNVKTLSVSSVICEFDSQFKSVGINQTLHSLYIAVKSNVKIELPFRRESISCQTAVLISETVLVGKVPEIYLQGKLTPIT